MITVFSEADDNAEDSEKDYSDMPELGEDIDDTVSINDAHVMTQSS